MSVQVHVTAWPRERTVTVDVTGDLEAASAAAVATLLSRLQTDLVATVVVDLAKAQLHGCVPRALLQGMRAADGAVRHAVINVPAGVARPSACAAPDLLWHEREAGVDAWQEAVLRARPAATGGPCDCGPSDNKPGCVPCPGGCPTADPAVVTDAGTAAAPDGRHRPTAG